MAEELRMLIKLADMGNENGQEIDELQRKTRSGVIEEALVGQFCSNDRFINRAIDRNKV